MPFGSYFVIVTIVLASGRLSFVVGGVEELYDYFRARFDREGFQEGFQDELATGSLSDDEAVKLRFVKSEEGIVVPEDFFYDDEGEREGRARRSVDQNQRDGVVQALNDIRRSVNSSDLQYMYWNGADEPMLNTWTSGCQYSAKVYVTATARIIKMVTDKPPDFVAQLYESFGFPDLQRLLTSAYIIKVSANSNFCSKLITNSTTTFNNSYLGVISLTYVTGFKVNTTQFTVGPPCTACLSGVYWCDKELCRADCRPAIPTCYCRPACLNCAGYNETTCKCNCLSGWVGARCERNSTLTPTVPNCTTIAPSTYPTTITSPITSEYYYVSNATALQTTTETNLSTTSFFIENMTTVQPMNETTNETASSFPIEGFNKTTTSFFDENITTTVQPMNETTNETTSSFPIEGFNETTSFFIENMTTTVQPMNETTNETTSSFPIEDFNETTTSFFDENMTTTVQPSNETTNETTPVFPLNETTSALFSVTEQSTFTPASSINNILNTSATSPPIQPTLLNNNNPYDFYNYTRRLLDIENMLLRLLLMFQVYLTPTTTTTTTTTSSPIISTTASTGTSSLANASAPTSASGNVSSGTTTPLPASNFSSVAADTVQANSPAVDTENSTHIAASSSSLTSQAAPTNNGDGTSTINASLPATAKPPNTIPTDLSNYLKSLEDLKNMILRILLALEVRLTTTTPSQSSPATAAAATNATVSTGLLVNQTATTQYQNNPSNNSTAATNPPFLNASSSSSSSNISTAAAAAAATTQANNSTSSVDNKTLTASTNPFPANGANTFPSTSSPLTLSDPYNPLLLSLFEIVRRLEKFLQTLATPGQNSGSTTIPGTASQSPPGVNNNNNNNSNTTGTSTAPRNEANISVSTVAAPSNTSSSHDDQGHGSNLTWTSPSPAEVGNNYNNSANSSTKPTLVSNDLTSSNPANSSSSDRQASPPSPFFGSNSSGVSTATTTTTTTTTATNAGNTALNLNGDPYLNEIQQLLINILKSLDDVLRQTTLDESRPTTSRPNVASRPNVTESSIYSNASTTAVYHGNTSNATHSPGAAGPPTLAPNGSATRAQAAPNLPVREFIIRIWDYGTSAAAPQPRSAPKNLMSIFLLLMGTILQVV